MSLALFFVVLGVACDQTNDPPPAPAEPPPTAAATAPPVEPAPEGPFPRWDLWSDCQAYCVAVKACDLDAGGAPMDCYMGCDVAAQWEGQPMPDEHSAAVRELLLCAVKAADCAALTACLAD